MQATSFWCRKPSYPLFEFLADLQDVKLIPYPLIYDHGWQMDFHSLQKAVSARTRGVVVVHPNNPTGSYVHATEFEPLNKFCAQHGLALIVDEVFLDYPLDDSPHASFAGNRHVLTFTLSGLSKISALPQMKVAWLVTSGPENQVNAAIERLEVIADTYLSMNAPVQWAIPVLLEQRHAIQRQLRERVKSNLAELDRRLESANAYQRLSVEGGWYVVLRVPVTRSDEELAIELVREKSVLVHPGHFYDFPSDGYLVLSLITAPEDFIAGSRDCWSLWGDRAARGPSLPRASPGDEFPRGQVARDDLPELLSAAHCGHDGDLRILRHTSRESASVPDVLIANEDVDMLPNLILLVEYSIPDAWIGIPKCGKCLGYRRAWRFQ